MVGPPKPFPLDDPDPPNMAPIPPVFPKPDDEFTDAPGPPNEGTDPPPPKAAGRLLPVADPGVAPAPPNCDAV